MTQKLYNTHRNFIEISKSLFTRKINILFYRIKDTYCCSFEFNFIWLLFSFPYVRVFEKYDATSKYKKETTTKCSTALKRQKIWTKQNRWFVQVEHIYIKWLWNFLIRFMFQILDWCCDYRICTHGYLKSLRKFQNFFFELFIEHTTVNCFQNASNIAKALYSIISVPIICNNKDDVIFV